MDWIQHLQKKWQVTLWGALSILITFSLAGISVVQLKTPILNFILPENASTGIYLITYILLIFPLYQILLLFFGTILGQFSFFWEKEKKMVLFLLKKIS
jgi:CHASE2 domain-containing sensor protein